MTKGYWMDELESITARIGGYRMKECFQTYEGDWVSTGARPFCWEMTTSWYCSLGFVRDSSPARERRRRNRRRRRRLWSIRKRAIRHEKMKRRRRKLLFRGGNIRSEPPSAQPSNGRWGVSSTLGEFTAAFNLWSLGRRSLRLPSVSHQSERDETGRYTAPHNKGRRRDWREFKGNSLRWEVRERGGVKYHWGINKHCRFTCYCAFSVYTALEETNELSFPNSRG